ncbi:MAG: ribokinase [Planctomycetes bacterium]|nr:ribokinase [Planctomycetota bacterium]
MEKTIAVVGSAHLDFTINIPRLPKMGETLTGGVFNQGYGGKGSNQMIAARRAGGNVVAVASLGNDPYGQEYRRHYEREGIDTSYVVMHDDVPCGVAIIQVDANGNNTLAIATGSNALLSSELVNKAEPVLAGASMIMLQMEIPDAPIRETIRIAKANGVPVMLNFAPVRETELKIDGDIPILVVNEPEACSLTGIEVATRDDAIAAAKLLGENGHRLVIVTLGADGCVVLENGVASHYPAPVIRAVDTTAAGDSFCGALAVALVEGKSTAEAIRFATAAGALCATKAGAMPSLPRRVEIEDFASTMELPE